MNKRKRIESGLVALSLLLTLLSPCVVGKAENIAEGEAYAALETETDTSDSSYVAYRAHHADASVAAAAINLDDRHWLAEQSQNVTFVTDDASTEAPVWKMETGGQIVFEITVEQAGLYTLSLPYKAAQSGIVNGSVTVYLDGVLPFAEAADQELARLWTNVETIRQDPSGNDIRPAVEEVEEWQTQIWRDPVGKQSEPLCFYLLAGVHRLTLLNNEISLLIQAPVLGVPTSYMSYAEYRAQYADKPLYDGVPILIEAENTFRTSSRFLVAANDMTSPLTTPYDAYYIRLNTLSGNNWRYIYDRVTWEVTVPTEGMYRLSFRFMQNFYNGLDTHRRLYINGEVPFGEVAAIDFAYSTKWQSKEASDYYYYLKTGKNTISMEVVLGKYAEILQRVEDLTARLNRLYRRIIMVTGPSPDIYRDYNLEKEVPGLLETFSTLLEDIETLMERLRTLTGVQRSSELSTLDQLSVQIRDVLRKPSTLTKGSRLSRFNTNISSLGAWANKLREQPLLLDSLTLLGAQDTPAPAEAGVLERIWHKLNRFYASFIMDYSRLDGQKTGQTEASIRVWLFSGRDQAQLLKNLVDSDFTPRKNIHVTVELVSGGIIEAMLAGKGPDVALGRAESDPVDYAMRKAVLDLSQFDGFDEVTSWFEEGTMRSFEYSGGYYALPETQVFNMLFYRTDIFEELGLTVPHTWEDLLQDVLPVLQQYNMTVGIGNLMEITDNTVFTTLLYQMGGQLYADDRLTAALDTQMAYEAFKTAVEMYRDYGAPREYDFMNRFRTGEIPLAIAPYAMYNNLKVGAPELNGLWEMVEVPGVLQADGTIRNTQVMGSTAAVISARTKEPEASWEFLRWWVCADTQTQFGNNLEAILGAGGRYTPANKEALQGLSWGASQLAKLEQQRSKNTVLPQLPGSYFTKRAVYNAFVSSIIDDKIPREQLLYWNEEINLELARKRREFSFQPTKGDAL